MIRGNSIGIDQLDKYITYGAYLLREKSDGTVVNVTDEEIAKLGGDKISNELYHGNIVTGSLKYGSYGKYEPVSSEQGVGHNTMFIVPYLYYKGPIGGGNMAKWRCNEDLLNEITKHVWIYMEDFSSQNRKKELIEIVEDHYYVWKQCHKVVNMGFVEYCLNLCLGYDFLLNEPIHELESGMVKLLWYSDDRPDIDDALLESIKIRQRKERFDLMRKKRDMRRNGKS